MRLDEDVEFIFLGVRQRRDNLHRCTASQSRAFVKLERSGAATRMAAAAHSNGRHVAQAEGRRLVISDEHAPARAS
jgi:hypothetical protein